MESEKSAGGIVMNGNKVALVYQKNGTWSLPKGHIKANETPQEAAIREIYEETGMTELKLIKHIGSYTRGTNDPEKRKTITMFYFITGQKTLKPIDADNPKAIWADIDDVTEKLIHKEDKEFFLKAIEEIHQDKSI